MRMCRFWVHPSNWWVVLKSAHQLVEFFLKIWMCRFWVHPSNWWVVLNSTHQLVGFLLKIWMLGNWFDHASVDWLVSVVTHSPRIVACERSFLPFVLWYMTLLHTEKVALRDSFIFKNKKHTRRAHSGDPYLSGTFFALIFSCSWIQAQDFFHIFPFDEVNQSMVRRELARFGCMYVCRHHTIALTLLCWMVLWWRGGEGERERGYLASHILHLNLFWGKCPPSHLQVVPSCTFNCG